MSRVGELVQPPKPLGQKTARELVEQWTPGIFGDGNELAKVLAVEATVILIQNGGIPADAETEVFMRWYREHWSQTQ